MKKNFFKKLAFVLAAAMVVPTAVVPAAGANAAAAPDLTKRYANVYEGSSYTYTAKNVASGQTVKWTVSGTGKDYAELSKKTGKTTKLTVSTNGATAAKNATFKVTANVYDKNGKLVKAAGDVVKIKVNASALSIKAAEGVDVSAVPANEEVKFSRVITPANATSVTYWSVTNKDGSATDKATISEKGQFKATEAGEYTIKAEAKNAKNGVVKASATLDVVVGTGLKSIKQTVYNQVEAYFSGDLTEAKASDFTIVQDGTNAVIPVKSATLDKADKKKVAIETYSDMKDGKVYNVTYDKKTVSFTATDGTVASVNVTPLSITYDKETTVKAQAKDANGVVVKSIELDESDADLEVSIDTTKGYENEGKLYLPEVGDTAKATVTYHTGKYDNSGVETGAIKQEFTITAVKDASTISAFRYTITGNTSAPSWKTLESKDETHAIAIGADGKYVHFQIKDSNDDDVTTNYKIESSDRNKLIVDEIEFDGDIKYASIAGIKEGTAYILIKNKDTNATVQSVPVTVRSEGKAVNMTLGTSSLTISTEAGDVQNTSVVVKNQYGDELEIDSVTAECSKAGAPSVMVDYSDLKKVLVKFDGSGAGVKTGSYSFKITAKVGDKELSSKTVTVTVKAPTGSESFALQLTGVDNKKVDITVKDTSNAATTLGVDLIVKANGVYKKAVSGELTDMTITVKKADGTVVATANGATLSKDLVEKNGGTFKKVVTAGTYKVSATAKNAATGKSVSIPVQTFTVEDKQSKITFDPVKLSTSASDAEGVLTNTDYIQFYYAGDKVDVSVGKVDATPTGNSVRIKTAWITIADAEGSNAIETEVTINTTFLLNR